MMLFSASQAHLILPAIRAAQGRASLPLWLCRELTVGDEYRLLKRVSLLLFGPARFPEPLLHVGREFEILDFHVADYDPIVLGISHRAPRYEINVEDESVKLVTGFGNGLFNRPFTSFIKIKVTDGRTCRLHKSKARYCLVGFGNEVTGRDSIRALRRIAGKDFPEVPYGFTAPGLRLNFKPFDFSTS